MTAYTYRAVNLAGIRWIARDGIHQGEFNTARPGYGLQCVETGRFLSFNGEAPYCVRTKATIEELVLPAADNFDNDEFSWVGVIPPAKPKSWSDKRYREFWSARQHVDVHQNGTFVGRYRHVDLVSAWVIARRHLTRDSIAQGYRVTVTPSTLVES